MIAVYECGICNCLHPWDWNGDCRDNVNRFASVEDVAEREHVDPREIDVYSWEDRQQADREHDFP